MTTVHRIEHPAHNRRERLWAPSRPASGSETQPAGLTGLARPQADTFPRQARPGDVGSRSAPRVLAVTNMYPIPEDPSSGVFIEQQVEGLRRNGLEVDVLLIPRDTHGMRAYVGMATVLRERIHEWNPDVVHIMYGGVMAAVATRVVQDRPTIITFHGSDLLGDYSSGLARRIIAAYGVWASRRAARRANGVIVVAKHLKDRLPGDIDPGKVQVIPCGIDMDRFKPLDREACRRQIGWRLDRFHVLFPANSGSQVKRPELARTVVDAAYQAGIPAELHHLCGVSNAEVPLWLNASDVLLLTSLHEGSPTVVKEALACNIPIVSVDVGDVRERIQGIQGCYIGAADPANPAELADKLRLVYEQPHRIDSQARAQELSLEHIAAQLNDLYADAVAAFHARSEH